MPARIRARWLAALLLSLQGCGGGFYVRVGSGFDGSPPVVTLAATASTVAAGQPVRFVAAAADESGIANVRFYRVDPTASVLLGTDANEPYEWSAIAPTDGRTTLVVFARALDSEGNVADSAAVVVTVTP